MLSISPETFNYLKFCQDILSKINFIFLLVLKSKEIDFIIKQMLLSGFISERQTRCFVLRNFYLKKKKVSVKNDHDNLSILYFNLFNFVFDLML